MTNEITSFGSINVSPQAIASIAYQSALQSYGVVGMASKNVVDGLTNAIAKDPTHGVEVHYDGTTINIDMYIRIITEETRPSGIRGFIGLFTKVYLKHLSIMLIYICKLLIIINRLIKFVYYLEPFTAW